MCACLMSSPKYATKICYQTWLLCACNLGVSGRCCFLMTFCHWWQSVTQISLFFSLLLTFEHAAIHLPREIARFSIIWGLLVSTFGSCFLIERIKVESKSLCSPRECRMPRMNGRCAAGKVWKLSLVEHYTWVEGLKTTRYTI